VKIATIVGTRPEIIKLSECLKLFDQQAEHELIHTGQNYDYELNEVFFEDLGLRKPDHFLNCIKGSAAEVIGDVIAKSDILLREIKPDAIVLYGDTNSCMSVVSAKRLQIPIFHLEAGNRCFDQRVPEEINRKVVDHLSDINLTLSEHARRYLIAEGLDPSRVIKIGSPMREVLDKNMTKINSSEVLTKENLKEGEYFLVSIHREENVDYEENLQNLLNFLILLEDKYGLPIIVSTHPRTKKKIEEIKFKNTSKNIKFLKPFGFHDYNKLQLSAKCLISDSGTVSEESSILRIPAISIRNAHERPEGMDNGSFINSGTDPKNLMESLNYILALGRGAESFVDDYQDNNISEKVLKIIFSYTHYVNKFIWKKQN
jgi:UDP-N-acetylglucosamine 2-epimerase (non-hydrolysing)